MKVKLNIKKGDRVLVISGEHKGEEGRVLEMIPKKSRALVEGLNLVKRHTKPNATHQQGGIIEKEAPIHISNLMLIEPKTGEATRIGRKRDDNGELVRYSKATGEIIK